MVFCNAEYYFIQAMKDSVTILILVDGFLQYAIYRYHHGTSYVTILILVDGFLQWRCMSFMTFMMIGHNPYFSRWFSAIHKDDDWRWLHAVTILILVDGFLQCI